MNECIQFQCIVPQNIRWSPVRTLGCLGSAGETAIALASGTLCLFPAIWGIAWRGHQSWSVWEEGGECGALHCQDVLVCDYITADCT